MKTIRILIPLCALLIAGCNKDEVVYTTELSQAINSQSNAMLVLYDLVNIHTYMVDNNDDFDCFHRTKNIEGTMYSDFISIDELAPCYSVTKTNTHGSFLATYPITPAYAPGFSVEISLLNFYSNGVAFTGDLRYEYINTDSLKITSSNMTMTDSHGTTTVTADLLMTFGTGYFLKGNVSGSGANNYSWTVLEQLNGWEKISKIHTGKASFKAYGSELTENFGNGEDDDLSTFEGETESRTIMILPKL